MLNANCTYIPFKRAFKFKTRKLSLQSRTRNRTATSPDFAKLRDHNQRTYLAKNIANRPKTKEEVKKLNERINDRREEWQKPVRQQTEQ